jgi:MFS family permease
MVWQIGACRSLPSDDRLQDFLAGLAGDLDCGRWPYSMSVTGRQFPCMHLQIMWMHGLIDDIPRGCPRPGRGLRRLEQSHRDEMTASSPQLDSRTAWVTATAALAILTISYGAPLLAVVALKPIAAELGTSRSAPAAAGSFTYIGAAIGGIMAGWLSGRLGIRRIVVFGAAMLAAGLIVSASGGLLHLYVGHGVLMGLFGTACMLSPLVTYVSRWFDRRRAAAVALISSGQSVSGALWPVLFQAEITNLGWRLTMMVYGLFAGAAIVLLTAIFLRPPPEASSSPGAARQGPQAGATVIGLPPNLAMVLLMVAVFCCCVPMAMPIAHVVAFCGDHGFAPQHGAAMLSVLLGSAFLSRQFWGWLADRVGGLQTLLWSSLAQMTALSGFLLTQNEVALFGVSSAFGLARISHMG